jgi:DNA-binding MarR family transcriptional regulator
MAGSTNEHQVLLDERLCLALYTASRAMTARYRPLLSEWGLTYPQYLVMVVLWEDGDSTVRRIGQRLRLESSTLSPLLKRLEAMGLLVRTRNEQDERSVLVSPTPQGAALRDQAAGVPDEICAASGLRPPEMAELVAELRLLATHLEESLPS